MRRLSMPVVAGAFSSDAKKGAGVGAYGVGAGIAGGGQMGYGAPVGVNGPARFEQDSTGGISNVGLMHARPRKISFGRR